MKKLLLMALMVLGTSAFASKVAPMAGTVGTTEATLPVTVKGVIVANTGINLVITPTLSGGPGTGLVYDFGDLIQETSSVTKYGKYTIKLLKNGEAVAFVKDPVVKLEGGEGTKDNVKDVETKDAKDQRLAKIHYENSVLKSGLMYEGTLTVSADPSKAIGTGIFMTNEVGINVSATNQNEDGQEIKRY